VLLLQMMMMLMAMSRGDLDRKVSCMALVVVMLISGGYMCRMITHGRESDIERDSVFSVPHHD
jgi:hypothetical protein